jgi:uncharacterized protein involved in exopolysaccharide biosynthesis
MASLNEAKDISPFQVILKAKIPERKSKPVRSKMLMVAIFTSLLFSIIGAFVLENFAKMSIQNRALWSEMGKMFFLRLKGK